MYDFTITTTWGQKRHIEAVNAEYAIAIARLDERDIAEIEWNMHPDE